VWKVRIKGKWEGRKENENKRIKPNTGTNEILLSALLQFGAPANISMDPSKWNFALQGMFLPGSCTLPQLPIHSQKLGRGVVAQLSGDIDPAVRVIPYSIGYVAFSFVQGRPVASIINPKGNKILPSIATVTNAINSPIFNHSVATTCILSRSPFYLSPPSMTCPIY
jgi:hypothetical protein